MGLERWGKSEILQSLVALQKATVHKQTSICSIKISWGRKEIIRIKMSKKDPKK